MTTTITYRQTKTGQWVAYGPAAAITAGATVTVTRRSGETKTEHIASVGRPFTANGTQMVYGYLTPRTTTPRTTTSTSRYHQSHSNQMCDECGTYRGTIPARDMSGIPGMVCGRCSRQGNLSFA